MKILQLWYGEKPEEQIIDFMKHNLSLGFDYVLVSNSNFLEVDNWINIRDVLIESGIKEKVDKIQKGNKLLAIVDLLRIYLATKDNFLYLDADAILLNNNIEFDLEKNYLIKDRCVFDYWAFYCGDSNYFKNIYDKILNSFGIFFRNTLTFEVLNNNCGNLCQFCGEDFFHLKLNKWRNR